MYSTCRSVTKINYRFVFIWPKQIDKLNHFPQTKHVRVKVEVLKFHISFLGITEKRFKQKSLILCSPQNSGFKVYDWSLFYILQCSTPTSRALVKDFTDNCQAYLIYFFKKIQEAVVEFRNLIPLDKKFLEILPLNLALVA